jgi:hypothetical protein
LASRRAAAVGGTASGLEFMYHMFWSASITSTFALCVVLYQTCCGGDFINLKLGSPWALALKIFFKHFFLKNQICTHISTLYMLTKLIRQKPTFCVHSAKIRIFYQEFCFYLFYTCHKNIGF